MVRENRCGSRETTGVVGENRYGRREHERAGLVGENMCGRREQVWWERTGVV